MDLLLPPGHDLPDWAEPLDWGRPVIASADEVPNELYHGTRALVSKSALDVFARSPAHYLYYLQTGLTDDEVPESEALLLGSAFHSLVLEPEDFARRYVQLPDFGTMQSSKNRALRDSWLDQRPGTTGLKLDQWRMLHAMRESVYRHKRLRRILENGRPEVTCAAVCPHTGLPRKVRVDWVSEIDGIGIDMKSALDGSPDVWKREAAKRRYHVQDGYYTETCKLAQLNIDLMGFGVVEKSPPYIAELYTLEPGARLAGEMHYMDELQRLAECCDTGIFPGYSKDGEVCEITLPRYATAIIETVP